MALFNLDIERYYQTQQEEGVELKSIAYLQYPIYCIHADIVDSSPDPLEKLDVAILKCISLFAEMKVHQIAQLLSLQKRAVEMRIESMRNEKLIEKRDLAITKDGKKLMTNATMKRLQRRPYDFYLDGINFQPLKKELYTTKYLSSYFSENEYNYYTNHKGEIQINKPFKPNIIHEPLQKEKVIEEILNISQDTREDYKIPQGLEYIETLDFTKMTIPVLVGLFVKEGMPFRKLIDGFSTDGDSEKIISFEPNLKEKINKLELRLDSWEDKITHESKVAFASNWHEIDQTNNDSKLQFISTEDLMIAIKKYYHIDVYSNENIINTNTEIGLDISKELLLNSGSNKKQLLKNIERGRDYQMLSTKNGIWIVFISFTTKCPFVKNVLEILSFLRDAREKRLKRSHIQERLVQYDMFRQALVFLEEYELLEDIDINQNMHTIP